MNLTLRSVPVDQALEHEAFLDQALEESVEALGDEVPQSGAARRVLERGGERKETLVVFAEESEGAGPVAACACVPMDDPLTGAAVPLIALCYVKPDLRHRGIARALVHEASRLLAARGIHDIATRVGHNDDALISMGERWGFVRRWEWMTREG